MSLCQVAIPGELPAFLARYPDKRDATTKAVLRYLDATADEADAFEHLVAICSKAIGLCFLPAEDGIGTRERIQEWLSGFLAAYQGRTREELNAAAENDEFRFLGRKCRSWLIDALRAKTAKKNVIPPHVSLSDPVGHNEDGNVLTWLDHIGTRRSGAPSCLRTKGISFEEFIESVSAAFRAVSANWEELARLDLLDALRAILANAEHLEHESFRRFHARIVQSVARMRNVSVRAARAYVGRFNATVVREMKAGNPAVRAIYLELETKPPTPQYEVMDEAN